MSYPPPPPSPVSGPPPPPPPPADVDADPAWPPLPVGWWRGTRPEATFPVPFSVGDGFGLFAWFLLGQAVIGLPLSFIVVALGAEASGLTSPAFLGVVITTQAAVIATGLGYLKLRGRLSWRIWGPVRPQLPHVGWGALVGLGGFLGIQITLGLLLTLLGDGDPPEQEIIQAIGVDPLVTLLVVVTAVVLAPIGEELFFRGILFQSLRRRVGLWPAATISSVVFGVVHLEVIGEGAIPAVLVATVLLCVAVVPQVPLLVRLPVGALGLAALGFAIAVGGWAGVLVPIALALFGFVLALSLHRSGNLLVPILGHAVFNGIAIGLALLVRSMELPG